MNKKFRILTLILFSSFVTTSCDKITMAKSQTSPQKSSRDIFDPTFADPNEGDADPSSTYVQNKPHPLEYKIHPPMSVTHKGHGETQ